MLRSGFWSKLIQTPAINKPHLARAAAGSTLEDRPINSPSSDILRPTPNEGVVIRAIAGHWDVREGDRTWRCQARGRLKKGRQTARTVAVAGDRVRLQVLDAAADPPTAVIEEVLPRRNRISRMSSRRTGGHIEQVLMANLDQVVVVQSVREPGPQTGFIDRLLMASERFDVAGALVLNKCELPGAAEDAARWDYFGDLGYRVLHTSAVTGEGLTELADLLAGRVSLLLGASGVGKTSLLNLLEPGLGLRVGEVTAKSGLGRHTTTRTQLYPLRDGGFIADSPGIRGFEPWDVEPGAVRDYFPDFAVPADACRFRTCLHRDEPDCGVKTAVAAERIPSWRYEAYLVLLRDLEDRRARSGPGSRGRGVNGRNP